MPKRLLSEGGGGEIRNEYLLSSVTEKLIKFGAVGLMSGAIALIAESSWFLIASQVIIPFFSGTEAAAVGRYSYLGNSVLEIVSNLVLKPGLIFRRVLSLDTLEYFGLSVLPVIWGLSPQHLTPLVSAIPTLVLNILCDKHAQRDLIHQDSVPVLPFLLLAVISSLAAKRGGLRSRRAITLWSSTW